MLDPLVTFDNALAKLPSVAPLLDDFVEMVVLDLAIEECAEEANAPEPWPITDMLALMQFPSAAEVGFCTSLTFNASQGVIRQSDAKRMP